MSNDEPRRSRLTRLMDALMGSEVTIPDRTVTNYFVQNDGFASRVIQGPPPSGLAAQLADDQARFRQYVADVSNFVSWTPQDMPETSPTGRTATQAMEEQRLRARSNLMTVISTPTPHRSMVEDMDFSAIEERVVAQMLSAQATRSFARLADAGQSAALSMAEMERALRQNVGHPPTKLTKAELEPHPDTGKQVKPARIQRSLLGSEVTDVRLKSGRIERKAALQTTVEIKFKRRNQPKTG